MAARATFFSPRHLFLLKFLTEFRVKTSDLLMRRFELIRFDSILTSEIVTNKKISMIFVSICLKSVDQMIRPLFHQLENEIETSFFSKKIEQLYLFAFSVEFFFFFETFEKRIFSIETFSRRFLNIDEIV